MQRLGRLNQASFIFVGKIGLGVCYVRRLSDSQGISYTFERSGLCSMCIANTRYHPGTKEELQNA